MKLLAIDPGSTHSAYVVVDDDLTPIWFDKIPNEELLADSRWLYTSDEVVIEMVPSYGTGLAAGRDIYDTCVWIGRFWQAIEENRNGHSVVSLVRRNKVKMHICGAMKAKDGNVVQALIDRFAPNERNHGKGVKNSPGWFYGFHSDLWQAYALAVYWMDTQKATVT